MNKLYMILLIVSDCPFELNAQMLVGVILFSRTWLSSLYLLKSLSFIVNEILILVNLLLCRLMKLIVNVLDLFVLWFQVRNVKPMV